MRPRAYCSWERVWQGPRVRSASRGHITCSRQSIGRYSTSDGPFDVAWAYGDRTDLQSPYNTNRMWGAFNKVAPSPLTATMPYASGRCTWPRSQAREDIPSAARTTLAGHDDEPARPDRPADLLLTTAIEVHVPEGRRRQVGAFASLLERLRALLRLDHERAGRLDSKAAYTSFRAGDSLDKEAATKSRDPVEYSSYTPHERADRQRHARRGAPDRHLQTYLTNYSTQQASWRGAWPSPARPRGMAAMPRAEARRRGIGRSPRIGGPRRPAGLRRRACGCCGPGARLRRGPAPPSPAARSSRSGPRPRPPPPPPFFSSPPARHPPSAAAKKGRTPPRAPPLFARDARPLVCSRSCASRRSDLEAPSLRTAAAIGAAIVAPRLWALGLQGRQS